MILHFSFCYFVSFFISNYLSNKIKNIKMLQLFLQKNITFQVQKEFDSRKTDKTLQLFSQAESLTFNLIIFLHNLKRCINNKKQKFSNKTKHWTDNTNKIKKWVFPFFSLQYSNQYTSTFSRPRILYNHKL